MYDAKNILLAIIFPFNILTTNYTKSLHYTNMRFQNSVAQAKESSSQTS